MYKNQPKEKNPLEGKKVKFVQDESEKENADGVKGHIEAISETDTKRSIYDKIWKRIIDIVLSFCGLVILSPILLVLTILIVIDDPGPILFTQKRIGCNKQYFKLHKFRSMKMSTPHDKPTHMLENPEQYITKVGKFIRTHSLDGKVIIGTTTETIENTGFREVSPIHFFRGRDLISNNDLILNNHGGVRLSA